MNESVYFLVWYRVSDSDEEVDVEPIANEAVRPPTQRQSVKEILESVGEGQHIVHLQVDEGHIPPLVEIAPRIQRLEIRRLGESDFKSER